MRREAIEVETSHDGRVCRVTLPGGSLTARVARELVDVAGELLREDRSVWVVALAARGPDFCSGIGGGLDPLTVVPDPPSVWAQLRQPVVAIVSGRCRSVGMELLLATDVRIAHRGATFAMPDVVEGRLPCWGGTQRLARALRPTSAVEMLLLGDDVAAPRAAELGLLHAVSDDVEADAVSLIDRLAGLGPLALELAKEAVHRGAELPLRDGLRLEGDLNHLLAATSDRAEGLAAFFEKRPPDFAGR